MRKAFCALLLSVLPAPRERACCDLRLCPSAPSTQGCRHTPCSGSTHVLPESPVCRNSHVTVISCEEGQVRGMATEPGMAGTPGGVGTLAAAAVMGLGYE